MRLPPRPDADTGVVIVMVDGGGERTFVSGRGAATTLGPADLADLAPAAGDAVLVSGYGLDDALADWVSDLPAHVTVAFDPGPLARPDQLARVQPRLDWVTANAAEATALTGDGRNGHVRSSDGLLELDLAALPEMGGKGGATNPEQLFAAGYAACFHSALRGATRRQKLTIAESAVAAEVGVGPCDQGGFGLTIALHVEIGGLDQSTADELVATAHQMCPYSNATRGNIEVAIDTTVA